MYPARRGAAARPAAGLAAALLTAPGAYAATPTPDGDTAAPRTALQEIVVHARRRDEKLADAPLAISVRSGEQLRGNLALLLEDLGRDVPNAGVEGTYRWNPER